MPAARARAMPIRALVLLAFVSGVAATAQADEPVGKRPPPGSHEMLRAPVAVADGLEVIISDVVIPPNGQVPRHFHPGEEFLYVLEGSAVHVEEGKPDRVLKAGDVYAIPPRAAHAPRGGPDGARAVVFRLHVAGAPERILLPDAAEPEEPSASLETGQRYKVTLLSAGENKIHVIKEVRNATGLGLKQSKDIVEGVPSLIAEGLTLKEAKALATAFHEVGATVSVK